MRKISTSDKVALLEHRIANLEKQAFLKGIRDKVEKQLNSFKSVKNKVAKLFRSAGPIDTITKEFLKTSKTRQYELAMKELREMVGPNPIKQVNYLIDTSKNPDLLMDSPLYAPRRASMRKNSSLAFFLLNPELILVAVLVVGSVLTYILHKLGIKKFGSQNKEAFVGAHLLFVVVTHICAWFLGAKYVADQYDEVNERERYRR